MADNRYRERAGSGRSDSIFDDDRYDRGRHSGEGGFFERAGEEVRSWFGGSGDDRGQQGGGYGGASRGAMGSEGRMAGMGRRSDYGVYEERGRQQDYAGSYGRSYGGSSGGRGHVQSWGEANQSNEPWGGGDYGGQDRRSREGDLGQGSFSQTMRGQAPFDDHYRSWRDRQIEQLDRDYDEYRQHRQQQFESDFSDWRRNRQETTGTAGGGRTGSRGQAEGSGTTTGQAGTSRASSPAMASGGSSPDGGNDLSASDASTGSSGRSGRSGRGAKPNS